MRSVLYALAIFAVVPASAAEALRVVASVVRVHEEGAPMKPGVYIDFVVHAPAEFRGLPITMFAAGAPRRARRAEFPVGALFALQVPDAVCAALKKAKLDEDHIQRMIDDGVKPEMISQIVAPAQIDLAELATKPSRIELAE